MSILLWWFLHCAVRYIDPTCCNLEVACYGLGFVLDGCSDCRQIGFQSCAGSVMVLAVAGDGRANETQRMVGEMQYRHLLAAM
jgi:hypothetical protein